MPVERGVPESLIDEREHRRHRTWNALQSFLLLVGMALLLAACGWTLGEGAGALWALALGAAGMMANPQVSPRMVLGMYRARRLSPYEAPELYRLLAAISERAGLPVPDLHYVPSRVPNAFAVGRPEEAAIAVTDGLLRTMTLRELAGVLAHEVSHIRNRDLWVMGLADIVARMTGAMSLLGVFLLILNLPLFLGGVATVPWLLVLLLFWAPTLTALLQLALSRTREFDADLDAAHLTGDPEALASALAKLHRAERGSWERMLLPGRRMPDPSLLRTHPATAKRIRRLLSLRRRLPAPLVTRTGGALPPAFPPFGRPRRPVGGLWY
jgi:heat shock protein HtpX